MVSAAGFSAQSGGKPGISPSFERAAHGWYVSAQMFLDPCLEGETIGAVSEHVKLPLPSIAG